MSTPSPATDASREAARRGNGQFGAQPRAESVVDIVQGESRDDRTDPASPHYASLDELDRAGYVTDEWARWQQGGCAAYAIALADAHPHLKCAVMGTTELGGGDASAGWSESHWFAHDDTHAYDSAGRHPLPYLGIEANNDYVELDADPEDWGYRDEFADTDYAAALAHAEKHQILTRDPIPLGGVQ